MSPKIPAFFFLGGSFLFFASTEAKKIFPDTLGQVLAFHWGCVLIGDLLFSAGLFLSLYGQFNFPASRWRFLLLMLCNLVAVFAVPALYFMIYVGFAKLESSIPSVSDLTTLQKLANRAQYESSENTRYKAAKAVFDLYGMTLAFPQQKSELSLYKPLSQDLRFRETMLQNDKARSKLHNLLQGELGQLPYLFGFSLGVPLLTFAIGSLWVAFRNSMPTAPS